MAARDDRPADTWERDDRTVAWVYGGVLAGAAPGQVVLYTGRQAAREFPPGGGDS